MALLPIVDRELRVTARRAGTYRFRVLAGLLAMALWLFLLLGVRSVPSAKFGHHILFWMGCLALGFSMLAGVFLTSDCVSAEKREGTLGLLFLTDLKAYDIVCGKLVATSVHAFFGLLAVMPVLGLTLMMGGVTAAEFARLVLVFVVTLFFSLTAGVFVSTFSQRAMRATSGAFLLVLVFAGILPALWWAQRALFGTAVFDIMLLPSPSWLYLKAFDASYLFGRGASDFWRSLSLISGLACLFVISACVALPRVWKTRGSTPFHWLGMAVRFGRRQYLPQRRGEALARAVNPFAWLVRRDFSVRTVSWKIIVPLFALCVCLLIGSTFGSRAIASFVTCFLTAYGLHLILKVFIAIDAGRRISEDRQTGALELLLVTTLPVGSIVGGHRKALIAHFRLPMLLLSLINLLMAIVVLTFPGPLNMTEPVVQIAFCELFLGGILMLFLDFRALSYLAMWRALNHPGHRAIVGSLLQVMGGPWTLIFLMFALRPNFSEGEILAVFTSWFAVGATIDLVIIRRTRARLTHHFRAAASRELLPARK
jgi:hypothetical protein